MQLAKIGLKTQPDELLDLWSIFGTDPYYCLFGGGSTEQLAIDDMGCDDTRTDTAWIEMGQSTHTFRIRADGRRILPIPYSQDASTHQRSIRCAIFLTQTPYELCRFVRIQLVLRHLENIVGVASDTLTVRAKPFQESGGYIVRSTVPLSKKLSRIQSI